LNLYYWLQYTILNIILNANALNFVGDEDLGANRISRTVYPSEGGVFGGAEPSDYPKCERACP